MNLAARAYWLREPQLGEIRDCTLPEPHAGEVLVRTITSGISRGTEALVFRGQVPPSEHDTMRAPFQEGDFPGPVKYGYLNVGVVEAGPDALLGRTVFCLYPHQTRFVVPVSAVTLVPAGVPARRAVLAGTIETAVNALWDVPPLVGDRVSVVGAGMVGCAVARLLAGVPGVQVTLVDVVAERGSVAEGLGVGFATADDPPREQDLVFHTSASAAGLALAMNALGFEGTLAELSWYGDATVAVPLGGAFHSKRLRLQASQVGQVAPARRSRRTHADRLALALDLLEDPMFDVLLTGESDFEELPRVMADLASGRLDAICHTIDYSSAIDQEG